MKKNIIIDMLFTNRNSRKWRSTMGKVWDGRKASIGSQILLIMNSNITI